MWPDLIGGCGMPLLEPMRMRILVSANYSVFKVATSLSFDAFILLAGKHKQREIRLQLDGC